MFREEQAGSVWSSCMFFLVDILRRRTDPTPPLASPCRALLGYSGHAMLFTSPSIREKIY
jgi:hypothetical protein